MSSRISSTFSNGLFNMALDFFVLNSVIGFELKPSLSASFKRTARCFLMYYKMY